MEVKLLPVFPFAKSGNTDVCVDYDFDTVLE